MGRPGVSLALAALWMSLALTGCTTASRTAQAEPRVPVLIYHEIVTDDRPSGETVISLARFTEQMRYLAEHGYSPIRVSELTRFMRSGGRLPPRPIVLTFDDGWKSALRAVPMLEAYGFKASFWIIAGPKGIGGDYLGWADIEALAAHPAFDVESHTASHPWDRRDNLVTWVEGQNPGKGLPEALAELVDSRLALEAHIHRPVIYLAWPCGWYDDTLVALAQKAGYQALLTTESGMNRQGDSVLAIRRIFVDGSCDLDVFAASLRDGQQRYCRSQPPAQQEHLPYPRARAAS